MKALPRQWSAPPWLEATRAAQRAAVRRVRRNPQPYMSCDEFGPQPRSLLVKQTAPRAEAL
jgi:hypothetical protein